MSFAVRIAPRRQRRPSRALLALLALGVSACSTPTWEESKARYIDEVNQLLHREYPRAYVSGDDESLLALLTREQTHGETARSLRERRALFDRVTRATLILERVEPLGEERVRVLGSLQLHGFRDAKRISCFESLDIECRRADGAWRVESEARLARDLVDDARAVYREEAVARGLWNFPKFGEVLDRHGKPRRYPGASGLAVGDVDGDDLDDIYFVNGDECRLFRNLGDGTFSDVTDALGVAARGEGLSRSALIADFDNDGRNDIFVCFLNGPNVYLHQQADGTFTDTTREVGLLPTLESVGASAADFNGDGWLDIFVLNGQNPHMRDPLPPYAALNGAPNRMFYNNGDGSFREVSEEVGVDHTGWGLSCAAADYDDDGDTDLYVGNDFGYDVLFRNRGDGRFDDVTSEAGVSRRRSTMGSAWGDLDGDARPEFFGSAMFSNSKWFARQPGYPVPAPWPVATLFGGFVIDVVDEMLSGSTFYRNLEDGTFRLLDQPSTVNTGWSWSASFLDYDNDSLLDIYVLNGFVSGTIVDDL